VILSWRMEISKLMHRRHELLNAYVNQITEDDIIQFVRRKYTKPTISCVRRPGKSAHVAVGLLCL